MVTYRTKIMLGVIIAVLAGSGIAFAFVWYLPSQSAPIAISSWLTKGAQSDYGYGGDVSFAINLSAPVSLLSGAFATNTSLILSIMTAGAYQAWASAANPLSRPLYYYSTGDVGTDNLSVALLQGQWFMVLQFVNDTGKLVHTANGTGIVSDTHLTITQTFVAAPLGPQTGPVVSPHGLNDAELRGKSGSNVTGWLNMSISAPGYLEFSVDSETYTSTGGNSSTPQTSSAVVPKDVSFSGGTYPLSIPTSDGVHEVNNASTTVLSNVGYFPRVVPFGLELSISPNAPSGYYLVVLGVFWRGLDGQTTAYTATFTCGVTVQ
jgi:hypothetical protein